MKTYIVDWSGSCAVVRASNDHDMVGVVEPALADPSYPYSDCKVLEVPDEGVVNIEQDGSAHLCSDGDSASYFRLVWKSKPTSASMRPFSTDERTQNQINRAVRNSIRMERHYIPNPPETETADAEKPDGIPGLSFAPGEEKNERAPYAALPQNDIIAFGKSLFVPVGHRTIDFDDEPAVSQLVLYEAVLQSPKAAQVFTEKLEADHCAVEEKRSAMEKKSTATVVLWEALEALTIDDLIIHKEGAKPVLEALEKIKQWKKINMKTAEVDGRIGIAMDLDSRSKVHDLLHSALYPSGMGPERE